MSLLTPLLDQLPPWARVPVRCALLGLNMALVVGVVVLAESSGVGWEVAESWAVAAALLGQAALLWRLLVRPRATVASLSLQSLGILAVCHWCRFLRASTWAGGEAERKPAPPGVFFLAPVSSLGLLLAAWHRRELPFEGSPDRELALSGAAFGVELLRHFQGPRVLAARQRPLVAHSLAVLEQLVLPLAALPLGLLLLAACGAPRGACRGLACGVAASWEQALEALAVLPQLHVLLALRGHDGGVVVPPDLRHWLTSAAVGHLFAFATAAADVASRGTASGTLMLAAGEGFGAAVLGELLVAHFVAKCRGEGKLVLPA